MPVCSSRRHRGSPGNKGTLYGSMPQRLCTRLYRRGWRPLTFTFSSNVGLGEKDQAFDWLRKAVADRSMPVVFPEVPEGDGQPALGLPLLRIAAPHRPHAVKRSPMTRSRYGMSSKAVRPHRRRVDRSHGHSNQSSQEKTKHKGNEFSRVSGCTGKFLPHQHSRDRGNHVALCPMAYTRQAANFAKP